VSLENMCESSDVNVKNKCHVSTQENIFKGHMSYDSSVSPLGIITNDYLRDFKVSGFCCLDLLEYPKREALKRPLKTFF
jgi:hypothetical protein